MYGSTSISPPPSSSAVVVESFKSSRDSELSISIGDTIDVLHKNDDGWWKGENGGKVGLFPSSCVAEITASIPKQESENNATTAVDKPKIAELRKKMIQVREHINVIKRPKRRRRDEIAPLQRKSSAHADSTTTADQTTSSPSTFSSGNSISCSGNPTPFSGNSIPSFGDPSTSIRISDDPITTPPTNTNTSSDPVALNNPAPTSIVLVPPKVVSSPPTTPAPIMHPAQSTIFQLDIPFYTTPSNITVLDAPPPIPTTPPPQAAPTPIPVLTPISAATHVPIPNPAPPTIIPSTTATPATIPTPTVPTLQFTPAVAPRDVPPGRPSGAPPAAIRARKLSRATTTAQIGKPPIIGSRRPPSTLYGPPIRSSSLFVISPPVANVNSSSSAIFTPLGPFTPLKTSSAPKPSTVQPAATASTSTVLPPTNPPPLRTSASSDPPITPSTGLSSPRTAPPSAPFSAPAVHFTPPRVFPSTPLPPTPSPTPTVSSTSSATNSASSTVLTLSADSTTPSPDTNSPSNAPAAPSADPATSSIDPTTPASETTATSSARTTKSTPSTSISASSSASASVGPNALTTIHTAPATSPTTTSSPPPTPTSAPTTPTEAPTEPLIGPLEAVIALWDYYPQSPTELTLKVGDILEVVEKTEEEGGWWRGELNGTLGHFPKAFVRPYSENEALAFAVAAGIDTETFLLPVGTIAHVLYDYAPNSDTELPLIKGAEVLVLEKQLKGGWSKVSHNGRVGHAPSAYLQFTDEVYPPAKLTSVGKARALWAFEAKSDSELSLTKDDEITILKRLDGSWWLGEVKGVVGHFPKTYVQEEPSESPTPLSPRQPQLPKTTASSVDAVVVTLAQVSLLIEKSTHTLMHEITKLNDALATERKAREALQAEVVKLRAASESRKL